MTYADEAASFTVPGSIGLQGIRLIRPTFGSFLVSGLGLIGLLTAQLLIQGYAACRIDPDPTKCTLAEELGLNVLNYHRYRPSGLVSQHTDGIGMDGRNYCLHFL